MATFSQVMLQMQQHWPQIMQEVRSPKNPPNNLYIGEDRQPCISTSGSINATPPRW
ncbi:DNA primase TraC [Escherichia coli]|uniref:DNA primase TraC n=1 Tax=Escherichia coli TaxID=562 RepID=A0A2X1LVC5_ECOLX|nr:DNA primase TraC [Escherichia coli]